MKSSNPVIFGAVPSADQAAIAAYTRHYMSHGSGPRFPAEHLVRIFMGRYPRLDLDKGNYPGAPLLEVGCGDGRNFGLFHALGFELHGTEVSEPICSLVRSNLKKERIVAEITVGTSAALPYEDARFSYLAAWNSAHYLTPPFPFSRHIDEYARVLSPGGTLV